MVRAARMPARVELDGEVVDISAGRSVAVMAASEVMRIAEKRCDVMGRCDLGRRRMAQGWIQKRNSVMNGSEGMACLGDHLRIDLSAELASSLTSFGNDCA